MHQKLRLLRPLNISPPPIRRYSDPVHLPQLAEPTPELGPTLGGVAQGKRPRDPLACSPLDDSMQVGFQMHDRLLPWGGRETRMVATRDNVEHDRSRTEVKRHVVPDTGVRIIRDREFLPPGHNLRHPDSRRSTRSILAIGEQTTCLDDGAEIRAVGDVVQLGTLGHTHGATTYPDLANRYRPARRTYDTAEDPYAVLDQERSAETRRNRCPSVYSSRTGLVRQVRVDIDR